jgi:hypothetical protein
VSRLARTAASSAPVSMWYARRVLEADKSLLSSAAHAATASCLIFASGTRPQRGRTRLLSRES